MPSDPPRTNLTLGILAYIAVATSTVIAIPVGFLIWRRRQLYPLNGLPGYLSVVAIISCPLGMFAFVGHHLLQLPDCRTWKIQAVFMYFPGPTSVGVEMLYVYLTYRLQLERLLSPELRKLKAKFVSATYLSMYHLFLVGVLATPGVIVQYMAMAVDPDTGECNTTTDSTKLMISTAVKACVQIGFLILFWRLSSLLKGVDESFSFKGSVRKCALIVIFFCNPTNLANILVPLFATVSGEAKLYLEFSAQYTWCVLYATYLYWSGLVPLYLSYKHEASARKAMLMANDGRRSSVKTTMTTHGELRHALYSSEELCERFKEYLVKEFCVENMLFIIDVKKLKHQLDAGHRDEVLGLLKKVRENYLETSSDAQVNVSMELRLRAEQAIEEALQSQMAGLAFKELEEMEKEVLKLMVDRFNRYLAATGDITLQSTLPKSAMSVRKVSPS